MAESVAVHFPANFNIGDYITVYKYNGEQQKRRLEWQQTRRKHDLHYLGFPTPGNSEGEGKQDRR